MKSIRKIEIITSLVNVENDEALGKPINSERAAADFARKLIGNSVQEVMLAFMLATDNSIIGYMEVAKGCFDSCVVDLRFLFLGAVKSAACSIVLAHNHPSGNINPSREDIELTKRVVRGAELLGIRVLDHVIVSTSDSYSFLASGIIRAVDFG